MLSKATGHKARVLINAMYVIIPRVLVSPMSREPSLWPETGMEKARKQTTRCIEFNFKT